MCAICKYYLLYTALEHPPILVSEGSSVTNPRGNRWMTVSKNERTKYMTWRHLRIPCYATRALVACHLYLCYSDY